MKRKQDSIDATYESKLNIETINAIMYLLIGKPKYFMIPISM